MLTIAQRVKVRQLAQKIISEVLYDQFEAMAGDIDACDLLTEDEYKYYTKYIQSLTRGLEDGRATFTPDPNDSDE